jgi:hypothetical protein
MDEGVAEVCYFFSVLPNPASAIEIKIAAVLEQKPVALEDRSSIRLHLDLAATLDDRAGLEKGVFDCCGDRRYCSYEYFRVDADPSFESSPHGHEDGRVKAIQVPAGLAAMVLYQTVSEKVERRLEEAEGDGSALEGVVQGVGCVGKFAVEKLVAAKIKWTSEIGSV